MSDSVVTQRAALLARLFPEGVPKLWCPLLTHYTPAGGLDTARMQVHLQHVAQWVSGYLIPGSTGDGWELTSEETREVVEFALDAALTSRLHLLLGVLTPSAAEARQRVADTVQWLQTRLRAASPEQALAEARVCGFAVCPPTGAGLSQQEIEAALAEVLALGYPTALYQLPQITQNEMSPEVVARLGARFPNFVLFKDSSGGDRVALSEVRPPGVFWVRGAEGEYVRWLQAAGGPYDGMLLSTANCFAAVLSDLVTKLAAGDRAGAETISRRVTEAVREVFALVAGLPSGNAFTNANKAIDHFFAFGPEAEAFDPPLLHSGIRLPAEVIAETRGILTRHALLPERGYYTSYCRLG
jgi:dihydrodipicolinate synthase/N-acetylneuraminate lyase